MWKLVFGLVLIAGCQATSDARFASYQAEREAYYRCGYDEGTRIRASRGREDPYYIAMAAKQLCATERLAMIDGVMRAHGKDAWRPIIDTFDEGFEETVIAATLR